jgi:hypothetical protein
LEYEREAAERAVRAAAGVRAITDLIRLPARSADRTAAAPSPAVHPRGRLGARPRPVIERLKEEQGLSG